MLEKKYNRGFTLVELAIVLVIIGLLIGGILVAQSMMSTARVQSQIRQLQQYDIAGTNFTNQYKTLPGDDPRFWPACCPWGKVANSGLLEDNSGAVPLTELNWEPAFYFIALSMSGMLKEYYTYPPGYTSPAAFDWFGEGEFLPRSMMSKAANTGIFIAQMPNADLYYVIGTMLDNRISYTCIGNIGVMSVNDAQAIDSKIDDGLPMSGNVASVMTGWTSTPNATTPGYPVLLSSPTCDNGTSYTPLWPGGGNKRCCLVIKANVAK